MPVRWDSGNVTGTSSQIVKSSTPRERSESGCRHNIANFTGLTNSATNQRPCLRASRGCWSDWAKCPTRGCPPGATRSGRSAHADLLPVLVGAASLLAVGEWSADAPSSRAGKFRSRTPAVLKPGASVTTDFGLSG